MNKHELAQNTLYHNNHIIIMQLCMVKILIAQSERSI